MRSALNVGGRPLSFTATMTRSVLRHLPILEHLVVIELRTKRYRCLTCDDHQTTTQRCDWYEPRSLHTKAYDQSLLRQLINSTVIALARKQEVSYDSVPGAINRGVERLVNWSEFTALKVIGRDEIALRKGHRDFVVIVTMRHLGVRH